MRDHRNRANIHAGFMDVAEKMIGYEKRLGEYPMLSASLATPRLRSPRIQKDALRLSLNHTRPHE